MYCLKRSLYQNLSLAVHPISVNCLLNGIVKAVKAKLSNVHSYFLTKALENQTTICWNNVLRFDYTKQDNHSNPSHDNLDFPTHFPHSTFYTIYIFKSGPRPNNKYRIAYSLRPRSWPYNQTDSNARNPSTSRQNTNPSIKQTQK